MATNVANPHDVGVACDLCGGKKFSLLHEWPVGDFWNPATIPIAVWQCAECTLVFLYPVPSSNQLPDSGDWWSPKRKEHCRRRWFKTRWQSLRYSLIGEPRERMIRATQRLIPSGRLLDVGCGSGELMTYARKAYECIGLEPSPVAAAAARKLGFQVVEGTFESAELEPSSFDVVSMDAVIEHVYSPAAVLAKINTLLRPNGVVVLTTPKFGGPAYRMHGGGWNGFRHGYHTYLFSGTTLGRYLQQAGFDVARKPRRDRPLDDILKLWGRKVGPAPAALDSQGSVQSTKIPEVSVDQSSPLMNSDLVTQRRAG